MRLEVLNDYANRATHVRAKISDVEILERLDTRDFISLVVHNLALKVAESLFDRVGPALEKVLMDEFSKEKPKPDA